MATRPFHKTGRAIALGIAVAAVAAALTGCTQSSSASGAATAACTQKAEKKDVKLVLGVGSYSSAYWQEVIKGAKAVASSLDVPLTTFQSNFDGQTQLNNVTSKLAAGGSGVGVIVDPASNAYTKPVVQAAQRSGARIVTLWNRPVDVQPWNYGGGCWVAHTSFDGNYSGEENAKALFSAMGGSGEIVALQGVPDDPSNKQRMYGLEQALKANPKIKLLDVQTANWLAADAQKDVSAWLAKYPGQIKGIFSANDDMAIGAVAALRSQGLAGKIPVTGSDGGSDMLKLIQSGDALSTIQNDAYGQGAYATALAYAAVVGDTNPAKLSHAQRDFYMKETLVQKAGVQKALDVAPSFDPSSYDYAKLKSNLWADSAGAIDNSEYIPTVKLP